MSANRSSGVIEAMVVSFVVAGAAAAVLLTNFSGQGRLWDVLAARFREQKIPIATGPARVDGGQLAQDRMMLLPPDQGPTVDQPTVTNVAAAAPAQPEKKKTWVKHIDGSLTPFDPHSPATQHGGTVVVAEEPTAAAPVPAAPTAAPAAAAPKIASAAPAPAARAYVNYGNTARSDIMSGSAGPVYNFTGKK